MEYSIHELSKLSGVSARTLRYYHEIGLLLPLYTSSAGYRFYGQEQVALLQQILFYREQNLSLKQIQDILYREDFDTLKALHAHLAELEKQQKRLANLIYTVKRTIASQKGEKMMTDKEKFEAFKENTVAENERLYGEEIRGKYGDPAVDKSNQRIKNMSKEDYLCFQNLEEKIKEALKEAVQSNVEPDSPEGKNIAEMHKEWLEFTWSSYSVEAHKGLAQMYTADERFQSYYDSEVPGCAAFLKEAIGSWLTA